MRCLVRRAGGCGLASVLVSRVLRAKNRSCHRPSNTNVRATARLRRRDFVGLAFSSGTISAREELRRRAARWQPLVGRRRQIKAGRRLAPVGVETYSWWRPAACVRLPRQRPRRCAAFRPADASADLACRDGLVSGDYKVVALVGADEQRVLLLLALSGRPSRCVTVKNGRASAWSAP